MIVDENTREYLKMLQAIITRLNTNSFQIKTIATTIITSFMVFMYEKNQDKCVMQSISANMEGLCAIGENCSVELIEKNIMKLFMRITMIMVRNVKYMTWI